MPPKKSKKPASEMTDEELLASVFPKKVRDKLKQIAHAEKPKRRKKGTE